MSYHFKGSFYSDNTSKKFIEVISDYEGVFGHTDIRPPKIIVGVSITVPEEEKYGSGVFTVPAVLDTGCNRAFQIDKRHLELWSGLRSEYLPSDNKRRTHDGRTYFNHFANIYLHRTSFKSPHSSRYPLPPLQLKNTKTITVMEPSTEHPEPRLPLLGLRALIANRLHLTIDTRAGSFTLTNSRKIFTLHL